MSELISQLGMMGGGAPQQPVRQAAGMDFLGLLGTIFRLLSQSQPIVGGRASQGSGSPDVPLPPGHPWAPPWNPVTGYPRGLDPTPGTFRWKPGYGSTYGPGAPNYAAYDPRNLAPPATVGPTNVPGGYNLPPVPEPPDSRWANDPRPSPNWNPVIGWPKDIYGNDALDQTPGTFRWRDPPEQQSSPQMQALMRLLAGR